ncbi:hypothetical protein ACVFYP_08885 [Roseomonas sp. F4]
MAYSEEAIREYEFQVGLLLARTHKLNSIFCSHTYRASKSKEYAVQGFCRRLKIMRRCIENIDAKIKIHSVCDVDDEDRLDASINIQAFTLNSFGALDNLAHVIVEEKQLRSSSGGVLRPEYIGLMPKNTEVRSALSLEFFSYLKSLDEWMENLKKFRDALAHRIPIYIPPGISNNSNAAESYFAPVYAQSLNEDNKVIFFHAQLVADFRTVEQIAWRTIIEIGACSNACSRFD